VVVDAGSALSPCTAAALYVSDEVHFVANPDLPCLRNLQRLRDLVRLAGVPEDRVRYVLNRTSEMEVVPLREIEVALGRNIDHRFTSDYRTVAAALNAGVPLSTLRPGALRAELDTFARAMVSRAVAAA
jgi:Flp pilus assembly CpaE family ATPase